MSEPPSYSLKAQALLSKESCVCMSEYVRMQMLGAVYLLQIREQDIRSIWQALHGEKKKL